MATMDKIVIFCMIGMSIKIIFYVYNREKRLLVKSRILLMLLSLMMVPKVFWAVEAAPIQEAFVLTELEKEYIQVLKPEEQEKFVAYLSSITPEVRKEVQEEILEIFKSIEADQGEAEKRALQAIRVESLQLCEKLNAVMQQIGATVNRSKNGDYEKVVAWVKVCSQDISAFQKSPLFTGDLHAGSVFRGLTYIHCLAQHIEKSLDSHLLALSLPEEEEIKTRMAVVATAEGIDELLHKNSEIITVLQKKAVDAGLTHFNKAYRSVENILERTHALKIGIGVGLAAAVYYAYNYATTLTEGTTLVEMLGANGNPVIDPKTGNYATELVSAKMSVWKAGLSRIGSWIGSHPILSTTIVAGLRDSASFAIREDAVAGYNSLKNKIRYYSSKSWKFSKNTVKEAHAYLRGSHDDFSNSQYKYIENITFDDPMIIGLEEQKGKLAQYLDYLRDPERFIVAGNKLEIGILLRGPSRNGKTLMAQALAGTINKMFADMGKSTRLAWREYDWWTIKANGLRAIIADAQQNAPCIVFIDELHSLNLQTTGDTQMLNDFLTEMGKLAKVNDPAKQVFIIAATNRPELLDPALLSHERFGLIVDFHLPGSQERRNTLITLLQNCGIGTDDLDIESLVRQTEKRSYGDLHQIVDTARFMAQRNGEGVKQYHLQEGVNHFCHRFIDKNMLSAGELKVVAAHQAGASVAHTILGIDEIVELVSTCGIKPEVKEIIEWRDGKPQKKEIQNSTGALYGILVTSRVDDNLKTVTAQELEKLCKRSLAGVCAQKLLLGTYSTNYRPEDKQAALDYAQTIILEGLQLDKLSEKRQNQVKEEAENLVAHYAQEVTELLTKNIEKLKIIAEALEKERTLMADRFKFLMQS